MSERGVPLNPAQAIRLLDYLEETIRDLAVADEECEKLNYALDDLRQRRIEERDYGEAV